MTSYAYEDDILATRDAERIALTAHLSNLNDERYEFAHEIGKTAAGLFLDRNNDDLIASLAYMSGEMLKLAKVIDNIGQTEHELAALAEKKT